MSRGALRSILLAMLTVVVATVLWIRQLPSRGDCLGSGRQFDTLERLCVDASGSKLLREHVMNRAIQVGLGLIVLVPIIVGIVRATRSRSRLLP